MILDRYFIIIGMAPPRRSSIGVRTLYLILEHAAGRCVHADLIDLAAPLDVERVAEAAAFFLEFLVSDLARMGLQGDGAGLIYGDASLRR